LNDFQEKVEKLINGGQYEIIQIDQGNLDRERKERKISHYGLAGSSIDNTKPILKRSQLLQCIDAYMNDGTIRAMVNKRTDFILGNRTKYIIEPNEDAEFGEDAEQALETVLTEQEVKDLKIKINRINKRVSFHERLVNLLVQNFVLGRAAGGIERELNSEFPIFGEPIALKVLNGLRLKNPSINSKTWELDGIFYDYGVKDKTNVLIPSTNLLPLWFNDHNLYDNSLYTGMSAVWPILSMAQSNGYINDEDVPESCKSLWAKFGFVYVGDKNPDSMAKFEKNAKVGTLFFHNNPMLDTKLADLKQDIRELTDVRMANMKAMCINFGFPMFLLFEDSANFATAREVMQAYKAGVLERDRTWLRGFLEKYWYDPILADHLRLDSLEDLGNAKMKIKAAFEDINFETRKDIIDREIPLIEQGVLLPLDVAKDIDARPEIIERLSKLDQDELTRLWLEKKKTESMQKLTIA